MAHRQHRLLRALSGGGIENLVQQRDQRSIPFQRIALGSDVAGVDGLLENVGTHQLVENPASGQPAPRLRRFHPLLDPLAPLRDQE